MSIYQAAYNILRRQNDPGIIKLSKHRLDVHTEHCCKHHGCKYGEDETCTVVALGHRGMTGDCQVCWEDEFADNYGPPLDDWGL